MQTEKGWNKMWNPAQNPAIQKPIKKRIKNQMILQRILPPPSAPAPFPFPAISVLKKTIKNKKRFKLVATQSGHCVQLFINQRTQPTFLLPNKCGRGLFYKGGKIYSQVHNKLCYLKKTMGKKLSSAPFIILLSSPQGFSNETTTNKSS